MSSHRSIGTSTSQGRKARLPKGSKWDQAISEAKEKIKELRYTIKVFSELRDAGEPWPGKRTTDRAASVESSAR